MAVSLPTISIKDVNQDSFAEFKRKLLNFLIIQRVKDTDTDIRLAYLKSAVDAEISAALDGVKVETTDKFCEILDKLGENLLPKSNVVLDQYKFLRRVQNPNESFNEYQYDMKRLATNCKLGDQMENFLKVQLVIGVNDAALQERLLRNPELSLSRVIDHCKDAEMAKQSKSVLQGDKVGEIHHMKSNLQKDSNSYSDYSKFPKAVGSSNFTKIGLSSKNYQKFDEIDCCYCGTRHRRRQCPVYGK